MFGRGSKISLHNSVGILSGAVFTNGDDATSDVFDQAMQKNIESRQWSTHKFNSLHSLKLVSMYGFETSPWKPLAKTINVAICLFSRFSNR